MRINGVEKLTCITQVRDVTQNGGKIKAEPLRNFPVISDLAVDMGSLYSKMELVGAPSVLPVTLAEIEKPLKSWPKEDSHYIRLSDCIECGLCISACPISNTSPTYVGPAILAGAQQKGDGSDPDFLALVDCEDGAWRCHSAFECTAVCPSYVDPARRIMMLRKYIVFERFNRLFRSKPKEMVVKEASK
jgi:succinate dehydrogenase / fumarate reductase iron-sulfur subunit